jgi:pyruvate/2-oxoacid:ferredoxin oxidoreductase beta subunit
MKEAIKNEGFSLLEILRSCVIFKKANTYDLCRRKSHKLERKAEALENLFQESYLRLFLPIIP